MMEPLPADGMIWPILFELAAYQVTPEEALARICSSITPNLLCSPGHQYFFESWHPAPPPQRDEAVEFWNELETSEGVLGKLLARVVNSV